VWSESLLVILSFFLQAVGGSLGVRLIHVQTGGRWIQSLEPSLGKMAKGALPLALLLVLWMGFFAVPSKELLHLHPIYFSLGFRLLRGFLEGGFLLFAVRMASSETAGLWWKGLALAGVFLSLVAFANDTYMALDPSWQSSIFGPLFAVGSVLTALGICVLATRGVAFSEEERRRDVAHLILVFLLFWIYFGFSQYLIIWSAQIPAEEAWYQRVSQGAWGIFSVLLILVQFFIPFLLLLFRRVNGRPKGLIAVALLILLGRLMEMIFWLAAGGVFS
jgi:hypothetical protein